MITRALWISLPCSLPSSSLCRYIQAQRWCAMFASHSSTSALFKRVWVFIRKALQSMPRLCEHELETDWLSLKFTSFLRRIPLPLPLPSSFPFWLTLAGLGSCWVKAWSILRSVSRQCSTLIVLEPPVLDNHRLEVRSWCCHIYGFRTLTIKHFVAPSPPYCRALQKSVVA